MIGWTENVQDRLYSLIKETAVARGDFELASGHRSTYYVDVKSLAMTTHGFDLLGAVLFEALLSHLLAADDKKRGFAVGGLESGAIPLVCAYLGAADRQGGFRPRGFYVCRSPRRGGRRRGLHVVGDLGDDDVVLLDDVFTSGGSALFAHERVVVEHPQAEVVAAMAVVDREVGAVGHFRSRQVPARALYKVTDFGLPVEYPQQGGPAWNSSYRK
jgi:orotate phosphoribosyltransferase